MFRQILFFVLVISSVEGRILGLEESSYLNEEDILTFHRSGYLIKRNGISSCELEEMSSLFNETYCSILSQLKSERYECSERVQKEVIAGTEVVFKKKTDQEISLLRLVGCGSIEPKFLSWLRSKKMQNTFFSLLETQKIEHLICQMHPKMPYDGVSFSKHRDVDHRKSFDSNWVDLNGNGSYAICVIALDKSSYENGGLYVDIGSFPPGNQSKENIIPIEMEPGDMLFMHPELVHWSDENRSQNSRRTLLTGFCVFGANHKNYPGECTNVICHIDGSTELVNWHVD